jgi:hypothetical protein
MGVRKEWEAHGFKCRVLDSPFQGYNGYVAVQKNHPIFGLSYNDFDINVHGGITFADFGKDELDSKSGEMLWPNPELYWIGFDTAHLGDWVGYEPDRPGRKWSIEDVAQETEQIAKQLKQMIDGEKIKRDLTEGEARQKLKNFKIALEELDGVKIPFNIIKNLLEPLSDWLKNEEI